MSVPTGASNANATTPPEIEQTLTMLSGHRSVLGYMVLSRGGTVSIIRHSGVVFEGDQGKKYAGVIERIVDSVQTGLEEISGGQNEGVSGVLCASRAKRRAECFGAGRDTVSEDQDEATRADDFAQYAPSLSLSRRGLADRLSQRTDTYWPSCTTRPLRHGPMGKNGIKYENQNGNSHRRA